MVVSLQPANGVAKAIGVTEQGPGPAPQPSVQGPVPAPYTGPRSHHSQTCSNLFTMFPMHQSTWGGGGWGVGGAVGL